MDWDDGPVGDMGEVTGSTFLLLDELVASLPPFLSHLSWPCSCRFNKSLRVKALEHLEHGWAGNAASILFSINLAF